MHNDLDDFLDAIRPLSEEKQIEILLGYAGALVRGLDAAELNALRGILAGRLPNPNESSIMEIIEGSIALRQLFPSEPSGKE